MKTARQTLEAARDLITDPARWTQKELARDRFGMAVLSKSPRAVCWCAIGALARVCENDSEVLRLRNKLEIALPYMSKFKTVVSMNDYGDHTLVLGLYDRAIANEDKPIETPEVRFVGHHKWSIVDDLDENH